MIRDFDYYGLFKIMAAMRKAVENDPTTPLSRIKEDVLAQELQKYEHDKNLVSDILKEMPARIENNLHPMRQKALLASVKSFS